MSNFVPSWQLRQRFTFHLSQMYRDEVPAYGTLVDLVDAINRNSSAAGARLGEERHGAIRLALPEELSFLRRALAILGMQAVGYYDLATAGLPVHSTAFRPTTAEEIDRNPFRLFVSLIRLDAIGSSRLAKNAEALTRRRNVISPRSLAMVEQAERNGGLTEREGEDFLDALVETFRWRGEALSSRAVYEALLEEHPLLADVACFPNPHINHLTASVRDIDAAQARMLESGLPAKDTIEGPPRRKCPVLLRQTAFRALGEAVDFPAGGGAVGPGTHTARFGEIEQRGAALTPRGMSLYDECLARQDFSAIPDDWDTLRQDGLGWFRFARGPEARPGNPPISLSDRFDVEPLIKDGILLAEPIVYEDFLPVSAAGIFRSNLKQGTGPAANSNGSGNRQAFESALGAQVIDAQALYQEESRRSLASTLRPELLDA